MGYMEIIVSKDGSNVHVEAHGELGQSCENYTRPMVARLGVARDEGHTENWYEHEGLEVGN